MYSTDRTSSALARRQLPEMDVLPENIMRQHAYEYLVNA
jgi:hypothetical protein